MGLFSRTAPPDEHEPCRKRLDLIEERVAKLQLAVAENTLEVLDKAEKVAAKLKDRERKREEVPAAPARRPRPWEVHRSEEG